MYESQWLGYKRTWEAHESFTRKPAESTHNKFHSVSKIMYGSGPCRETALQSYFVQYISITVSAFLPTFRVLLLLCWTTPLMPKFNFDHVH